MNRSTKMWRVFVVGAILCAPSGLTLQRLADGSALDTGGPRKAGWSDLAILDTTLVVSYLAFVNRIADGLGVPLEEGIRGT